MQSLRMHIVIFMGYGKLIFRKNLLVYRYKKVPVHFCFLGIISSF